MKTRRRTRRARTRRWRRGNKRKHMRTEPGSEGNKKKQSELVSEIQIEDKLKERRIIYVKR